MPEGPVENLVGEPVPGVPDDDRLDARVGLLQAGKVRLDGIGHEQGDALPPLLPAAADREPSRGDHLLVARVERQAPQPVDDRCARARGRVGHEAHRQAEGA